MRAINFTPAFLREKLTDIGYALGVRVEEWNTVQGRLYHMDCRHGHQWSVSADEAMLRDFSPTGLSEFFQRTLTCQACTTTDRATIMALFEAPDFLRVPGGSE